MTAVAVIVALSYERIMLGRGLRFAETAADIEARLCGTGAGNAARAALAAAEGGARALVSFGCAGGLDPALGSGVVALPRVVRDRFGAPVEIDPAWRRRLVDAVAGEVSVVEGEGIEVASIVETVQDKERLFRMSACVFADMESASIGAVARARRLPFLVVRAVADTAFDVVPRCVLRAVSSEGKTRPGRLIAALARAPGEIRAVMTLARRFRGACSSLEAVARHLPAAAVGGVGGGA